MNKICQGGVLLVCHGKLRYRKELHCHSLGIQSLPERIESTVCQYFQTFRAVEGHQYGKKSTLITSQLPVKDRYDVIGKETIAGAVMNRITHLAVRIELHGESIRKICGKK